MNRLLLALLALSLVSACGSGGGSGGSGGDVNDVLANDEEDGGDEETPPDEEEPPTDGEEEVPDGVTGIPETLSQNVTSFAFSPDKGTVTISLDGVDTTPIEATYARNPALDMGGYRAYSVQEDSLDRLYIAMAQETADGGARAVAVGDGGQFNRVLPGGFYERDGDYTPPAVGVGPGAGQVSYAGNYTAITNATSSDGSALLPVDTTQPGLPDLPGQPAMVRATIFFNANFAENKINGSINNRQLISPIDGTATETWEDIELIITDIDENGEFFGDAEHDGRLNVDVGDYGGIISGADGSYVSGIVALSDSTQSRENDTEVGVFVLTQCGKDGDAAVCDQVQPN